MARHWPRLVNGSSEPILNLGGQGRARLVVLAAEVGGRWSEEARAFVSQLAKAKFWHKRAFQNQRSPQIKDAMRSVATRLISESGVSCV